MNRLFSLFFFLLFIAHSGLAQEQSTVQQPAKKTYTSIKAGINLTRFSGDVAEQSTQVGANGGVYFLYMQSEHFGIQPEIQYSLQGAGVDRGHMLLHYMVVPVMAKVFPTPNFSFQAGPYVGLLIKGKYEYEAYDGDANANGRDLGLAYGVSIGNESKVTVSARHHVGLTSLYSEKVKNQAIQLSLGVCIRHSLLSICIKDRSLA